MNQYVLLTLALLPPISILWYLLSNDKKENNNTLVYQLFFVTGLDEFTIGLLDNIRLKAIDLLGGSSTDFYRK